MSKNKKNNAPAEEQLASGRKHLAAKRTVGIISMLIFISLMVWATVYFGIPLVRELFGDDGTESKVFSEILAENPILGRLIFIGIQILQIFIALIPGEAVEIAGGIAFGTVEGLILCLIGIAIGSSIIFLLTKTLGMRFIELFVSREKINSLRFIREDRHLNELVFIMYFIPGTPKDVLTYVIGLTRMKLHTFLFITMLARIPSIITSTWGGSAIMNGDYSLAIILFAVTACISAVGLVIYNKISKKHSESANSPTDGSDNAEG